MTQAVPAAVDVLLVGLGPVGAAAANLLGRYGVRTLAIDSSETLFLAPRAIALDNEALRILQMAGLEDGAFDTCAIAKVQMRSPLFGGYAHMNTAGQIDGHPRLVTFHQPELERSLRQRLAGHATVQVRLGVELIDFSEDAHGVRATLRGVDGESAVVQARFLVGADGANSFVRRRCGLGFEGKTFAQDWLIVDALDVPDAIDHVEFNCDPARPGPRMIAPGGRQRWEFMLRPGETRAQMETPEKLRELLAPWCDADRIRIERTAVYRFHARAADRFSKGRIFLAGDAAHITPPFAGQGLVAGLRDAANLCWKLAWVIRGHASMAVLNSYDAERRPHAKAIIDLALLMGRLIMPRNRLAACAIHGSMALLQRIPGAKAYFEDLKIKPQNRFRAGLFRPGRGGAKLVRGGLFPQGLVRRCAASSAVPSDEALGQRLALVGFGCDPAQGLSQAQRTAWQHAGGCILQLRHRGQPGHEADSWEDLTDSFMPGAAPIGWTAVVRPDRTVLHDGPLQEVENMVRESLGLLGAQSDALASAHLALPQPRIRAG